MPDLRPVFEELRRRMSVHEDVFRRSTNMTDANRPTSRKVEASGTDDSYLLLGAPSDKYPDGQMFGGINIGKRYVSYHLMCVYLDPELLEGLSPALRKRMQGKSCFNFTRVNDALFDELADVTARGRDLFAERGWLAT
jgi:hypothetical protein